MSVTVLHADSRDALKDMADASIDACVCDPPYALVSIVKRFGGENAAPAKDRDGLYKRASAGFMGKQWDTGDTAFDPAFWTEVLRVLKPGAHLIAFGGTRTYHRLVCAIEDAGFEVRDQLAWLFGSGFPKSHAVGKAIERMKQDGVHVPESMLKQVEQLKGWGSALKPAHEPIVLARKPLIGTIAANVLAHGTGALNIDACRIEGQPQDFHNGSARSGGIMGENQPGRGFAPGNPAGRWPANVIHDGSEEVLRHFPETESGLFTGARSADKFRATYGAFKGTPEGETETYGDRGSAARFFYTAKADADDRLGSKHPTVKPVDLMAYLVRLVTPPGGVVLDPFAGSGTTGMACMREGFRAVLIEREAEYVADIKRRLAHVKGEDTPLFAEVSA